MDDKTVLVQCDGITVSKPVSPAFAKFLCLLLEPRQVEISNTRPPCYQVVKSNRIRNTDKFRVCE